MLAKINLEEISKQSTPKKSIRVTIILSKENVNQTTDESSPNVLSPYKMGISIPLKGP